MPRAESSSHGAQTQPASPNRRERSRASEGASTSPMGFGSSHGSGSTWGGYAPWRRAPSPACCRSSWSPRRSGDVPLKRPTTACRPCGALRKTGIRPLRPIPSGGNKHEEVAGNAPAREESFLSCPQYQKLPAFQPTPSQRTTPTGTEAWRRQRVIPSGFCGDQPYRLAYLPRDVASTAPGGHANNLG